MEESLGGGVGAYIGKGDAERESMNRVKEVVWQ